MPRTSLPSRASPLRAVPGNGAPVEPADERLARIESLLASIQKSLAVQFHRIADLQVQLDRAIADRPTNSQR